MYGCQGARSKVVEYYGLDLSPGDTDAATVMSRRYLTPTTSECHVQTANMGVDVWCIPDKRVDVVSCQLAIHYLFDKEAHVRHFFSECDRVVSATGMLLLSFTDGRSVVRRAREGEEARDMSTYTAKYYRLDVPLESSAAHVPSPFGNRYVFTMPGSVENVPEYLCHEGMLQKIASEFGFTCATSLYFDELAVMLHNMPYYFAIAEKMGGNGIGDPDALDAANLYRFCVLVRTKDAAAEFNHMLRVPLRAPAYSAPAPSSS
jgi:hypothetical protein